MSRMTPQDAQNRPLTGSQDADGSQSHRDATDEETP
jgi:hypothetical protein